MPTWYRSPPLIWPTRVFSYYRVEKPESDYPTSRMFAHADLVLFEELGDLHGQADIVHLTCLLLLRQQEPDKAQACFERSLALEIQSHGARPIMLADYGRHMGFVYQSSGDLMRAIQEFERSFVIRRDNGLTDQSMSAAASLGLALVSENPAKGGRSTTRFLRATLRRR